MNFRLFQSHVGKIKFSDILDQNIIKTSLGDCCLKFFSISLFHKQSFLKEKSSGSSKKVCEYRFQILNMSITLTFFTRHWITHFVKMSSKTEAKSSVLPNSKYLMLFGEKKEKRSDILAMCRLYNFLNNQVRRSRGY